MEITSHSLSTIRKNISLAGEKSVSQTGGVHSVRPISPANIVADRRSNEKVVSGELLGKYSSNDSGQSGSHFTYEQTREHHPGFYSKHHVLNSRAQQAVTSYQVNMHNSGQEVHPKAHHVDYFV